MVCNKLLFPTSPCYYCYKTNPCLSLSAGYVRVDLPMKNLTKTTGETVRLKCEITGDPRPQYRWFRNGAVIDGDSPRVQARDTHWGSK